MILPVINCVIKLIKGWLPWLAHIFLLPVFITRTNTVGCRKCFHSSVITLPPWLMTHKPYSPRHLCIVLLVVQGFYSLFFWCDFIVWLCYYCCFRSALTSIYARLRRLVSICCSVLFFCFLLLFCLGAWYTRSRYGKHACLEGFFSCCI